VSEKGFLQSTYPALRKAFFKRAQKRVIFQKF
jgi:hypothetical protein